MERREKHKKRKKPQPLVDKLLLGPLEKYEKYDKFPYKFVIHLLVLALSTAQILLVLSFTTGFARGVEPVWFLNEPGEASARFYYNIGELREHVQKSVDNFYKLGSNTLVDRFDYFYYIDEATEERRQVTPVLSSFFIRGSGRHMFPEYNTNLTSESLGPFDLEDKILRDFLSNVTNIQIQYDLLH